ncbi:hypothetical protein [Aspergillus lentulus non-segmented dsRNA virus 1]|uniref:Uncharacterized protein n=1 Tax=Aspergillus lentulus non-segmented dsRNA virus 1 TaxID=2747490 RepID=A0A7I8D1H4_9VIRU|nr:hypothetical protein [Aspergillus lentulus non-segmented dsRNA virus 1]BCH36648.1 hypothetical protein [Aspergillus lentulus non-segmented dsRNA virus 1]
MGARSPVEMSATPDKGKKKVEQEVAGSASATGSGTAQKSRSHEKQPPAPEKEPPPPPPHPAQPDPDVCLSGNVRDLLFAGNHPAAVLSVIQRFHHARGVSNGPRSVDDLFPRDWKVGRTPILLHASRAGEHALLEAIPLLNAWDKKGNEITFLDSGHGYDEVDRITARWKSPVEVVAAVLTAVKQQRVTDEDVLKVAQKSPEALEKLKIAAKAFKMHFLRFLDPVALRRSPEFNEVAQRYKRELRALIADQQRLVLETKAATRRVNALLGERDAALARLDPGYQPKRQTASDALASFGIQLGEEEEEVTNLAAEMGGVNLDDLDF